MIHFWYISIHYASYITFSLHLIKNLNIYTKKFQEDLFDVTFIRFIHTPGFTLQIES